MTNITQLSANANLFAQEGQRVRAPDNSLSGVAGATDEESAEELQAQFLQILTTQLENQNPLDPVDTTEFTNQLVQFSSLEQQIDTNLRLGQILDSLQISSSFSAFSYIGNDVEIATNQGVLQEGEAGWQYALRSGADNVEIRVRDSAGRLVYQEDLGSQNSGTYAFNFQAADALTDVESGDVLFLSIEATDTSGELVGTDIATNVTVDSVETGANGAITLRAGELFFSVNDILTISRTAANDGGSTPSNSNPA